MSYLRVVFFFFKKLIHPIVFLTSCLNSATIKHTKWYIRSRHISITISISSYSVRFGGKWACPTFGGYVQGVTEVKDNFFVYSWIILPQTYFKQGLALQIWKNKINNLPYFKVWPVCRVCHFVIERRVPKLVNAF